MLEAALYTAVGVAACSALAGSRTAWILLGSVAFCLLLDRIGADFIPVVWMLFDLVVVFLIVRHAMTAADCVIIALFIPAWVFYLLPDQERYVGSVIVTAFQLLLTAPFERLTAIPPKVRTWLRRDDYFDRLVAHARLAGA